MRSLVAKLRLKDAAELLKDQQLSLEDIAERCGFVSTNYFIACFYHYYRQTPVGYRHSL